MASTSGSLPGMSLARAEMPPAACPHTGGLGTEKVFSGETLTLPHQLTLAQPPQEDPDLDEPQLQYGCDEVAKLIQPWLQYRSTDAAGENGELGPNPIRHRDAV